MPALVWGGQGARSVLLLLANSHPRVWLEVCLGVLEAAELLSDAVPTLHLVPLQVFFFPKGITFIYLFSLVGACCVSVTD